MDRFETFKDMDDRWRWRLVVGDKEKVLTASNEAYDTQADALHAAEAVRGGAVRSQVTAMPGIGPMELIARMIKREEARRVEAGVEDEVREETRPPAQLRPGRSRGSRPGAAPTRLRLVGSRRPA